MIIIPEYDELLDFLTAVDKDFPTPLSDKVDLSEYTKKLLDRATISATKENGRIVSLVAGYIKYPMDHWVFIPLVGTLRSARGKGYARAEILEIIRESAAAEAVHLYAVKDNLPALKLYESIGFRVIHPENDPRPNDVHFVYELRGENHAD